MKSIARFQLGNIQAQKLTVGVIDIGIHLGRLNHDPAVASGIHRFECAVAQDDFHKLECGVVVGDGK